MSGDFVNGLFEMGGSLLILLNIKALYRDKEIKGLSPLPLLFFTSWGLWNCWFYPTNGFMWSFVGGLMLALVNLAWLAQILWYMRIKSVWILLGELEKRNRILLDPKMDRHFD